MWLANSVYIQYIQGLFSFIVFPMNLVYIQCKFLHQYKKNTIVYIYIAHAEKSHPMGQVKIMWPWTSENHVTKATCIFHEPNKCYNFS